MIRLFFPLLLLAMLSGCGGGSDTQKGASATADLCAECRMPIKGPDDSARAVIDGKIYRFDDPGCMVLWLQKHAPDPGRARLEVYTRDTHRWIDATRAHYALTDTTPMGYGFGAYEAPKEGRISYERMRLRMLQGLTLKDPKIRKRLLGE
ncbi:hypothetical protein [Hydrogenimonas sp.]